MSNNNGNGGAPGMPAAKKGKKKNKQNGKKGALLPGRPFGLAKSISMPGAQITTGSRPGVVRIRNVEQIDNVYGSGTGVHTYPVVVNAKMAPWLSAVSAHWQVIKFLNINIKYETSASTDVPGTVTLSPYYIKGAIPARKVEASDMATSASSWVRNLAGAVSVQVAGAMRDLGNLAKFEMAKAARLVFRTALLAVAGVPFSGGPVDMTADDYSPGSFIVSVECTASTATRIGNLIAEYDVELSDPQPDMAMRSLALNRTTTTPAALSLQTCYTDGSLSGDLSLFYLSNNTITFTSGGMYHVIFNWVGATPVPGTIALVDSSGNDSIDARAGGAWDLSSSSITDNTTGQLYEKETAAGSLQVYKFAVRPGDVLTIPDLGSGTMTSLQVHITPCNWDVNLTP